MPERDEERPWTRDVEEFILREVDSVPHLEALLLLWNSRPKRWSGEEMAAALYVSEGEARQTLQGLARRKLAQTERGVAEEFWYGGGGEYDAQVAALDAAYRRNLVRISRMIHAKASPGVLGFADAFRFTKDKE